jgi:hypothetical protein
LRYFLAKETLHRADKLSFENSSWRRLPCGRSTLRADIILEYAGDGRRGANLTITVEFLVIPD